MNVIQAWMLRDIVVEEEVHKARKNAKSNIATVLAGDNFDTHDVPLSRLDIVYDEFGAPRPRRLEYDETLSDDLPPQHTETVSADDEFDPDPYPGLGPPLR